MDNFDMNKYFDDFFITHTNAGDSIDDIVAKFTESANRALKIQREEEAKRKAEEKAKLAEQKLQDKRDEFTEVMNAFMHFMVKYEYITNDEYDQFWKDWSVEECDELFAELDRIASAFKFLQSEECNAFLKDFLNPLGENKIQKVSEKSNTNTSADTEWKTIGSVGSASQQTAPVQKDDKNMNKKSGKTPVIRVKLPKPNDFMDIFNDFLGGLK